MSSKAGTGGAADSFLIRHLQRGADTGKLFRLQRVQLVVAAQYQCDQGSLLFAMYNQRLGGSAGFDFQE